MADDAQPAKRRGRPVISEEVKAIRKKNGREDRLNIIIIGWQEMEVARRIGIPETSLRRALDGEGPSLPQPIRDWLKGISQYLKANPCPFVAPLMVKDKKDHQED